MRCVSQGPTLLSLATVLSMSVLRRGQAVSLRAESRSKPGGGVPAIAFCKKNHDLLPWLSLEEIKEYLDPVRPSTSSGGSSSSHGRSVVAERQLLDDEAERLAALLAARGAVLEEQKDLASFYVQVLEDRSLKVSGEGGPANKIACAARIHTADFRLFYGVQEKYTWTIRKYGEEVASRCAWGLAQKLEYYFDIWCNMEGPSRPFTEAEHSDYVEDEVFQAWCREQHAADYVTWNAMLWVQSFRVYIR